MIFSLSLLFVLGLVAADCTGTYCNSQKNQCVKEGEFCNVNSFDLWLNQNYPCGGSKIDESTSACYVCDNGMFTDDGSVMNNLCIDKQCQALTVDEGGECCDDRDANRATFACNKDVRGKICKAHLYCNFTSSFQGGDDKGNCVQRQGMRSYLLLGETCINYLPNESPWEDSPDPMAACADGFFCGNPDMVGNFPVNLYDYLGQTGTCQKANGNTVTNIGPPGPDPNNDPNNVTCLVDIHCGFEQVCELSDTGNEWDNRCVSKNQQCDFDSDCGWGSSCNRNVQDAQTPGYCEMSMPRKQGQYCDANHVCEAGLFCNNLGLCDSTTLFCPNCNEFGTNTCGRGRRCACPNPSLVAKKGTTESCRKSGDVRSNEASMYVKDVKRQYYECLNSSSTPQGDGFGSDGFGSVGLLNRKIECMESLAGSKWSVLYQSMLGGQYPNMESDEWFGMLLNGQPSCKSGHGPPDKKFLLNRDYMSAAPARLSSSVFALLAPLSLLLVFSS